MVDLLYDETINHPYNLVQVCVQIQAQMVDLLYKKLSIIHIILSRSVSRSRHVEIQVDLLYKKLSIIHIILSGLCPDPGTDGRPVI